MGLKTAFSYSALESIVSRVFDLLILWVVFNALPTEDVALFGVSTSAIFIFNLFFLTPETSLFKFQKRWKMDGVLYKYLSAFFSFSLIKILLHYLLIGCVYVLYDSTNWFFYAVIYSAIVQQVQISEICRIYFRLELQQRKVAIYELIGKGLLLLLVSFLFVQGSISKYYLIYYGWTCVMAVVWLSELRKFESIRISFGSDTLIKIKDSMFGYSLWTHVVGVMTMFIYNSNVLFLEWLGRPLKDVALFTVVNKVANLFFVLPMFIQSFVPVVLANIKDEEKSKLLKLLLINAIVSVGQFVFFVLFGPKAQ